MNHGMTSPQSAEAGTFAAEPEPAGAHHLGRARGLQLLGAWPLLIILGVQTIMSLRLVRANTAFQDEAEYLWAGHLQWAHWLHGAPIPLLPSYFSGAPILYPPIGAIADNIGGLATARILSMFFMLGATTLLWATANTLYGRRAAVFAAALFAVMGPTLNLGAFATYDSMGILLLALAAWMVTGASESESATKWLIAAGVVLALANASAYWTALFDPIVILLALLTAFPEPGKKEGSRRTLIFVAVLLVLIAGGFLLGGNGYIAGIEHTTFLRVGGTDSVLTILGDAWSWAGVIAVAALCGVIVGWFERPGAASRWLLAVLAIALVLPVADQAAIHTLAALNKHVAGGGWFAAIAAGYAVDRLIAASIGRQQVVALGACVVALALPVELGYSQSKAFATSWPNSDTFIAILRPLVSHGNGRLLVEDPSIAEYYLPSVGKDWQRWSSTRNIVLPSGQSTGGPSAAAGVTGSGDATVFARYIMKGYFSLVALNFADTTPLDHAIRVALRVSGQYKPVQVVPYGKGPGGKRFGTYVIWQRK